MIAATILTLSQDMNFASGEVLNVLSLRLANGKTVRALVSDGDAAEVVRLFVERGGSPKTAAAPMPSTPAAVGPADYEPDVEGAVVFGGTPSDLPLAPEPPVRRKPVPVTSDEWGYPVLHNGGVDPRETVGSINPDEDGVGQA